MNTKPISGRLSCGCRVGFRAGVEGSPVTVILEKKAATCVIAGHVASVPIYDHREALRPSTRHVQAVQPDYGDEN